MIKHLTLDEQEMLNVFADVVRDGSLDHGSIEHFNKLVSMGYIFYCTLSEQYLITLDGFKFYYSLRSQRLMEKRNA